VGARDGEGGGDAGTEAAAGPARGRGASRGGWGARGPAPALALASGAPVEGGVRICLGRFPQRKRRLPAAVQPKPADAARNPRWAAPDPTRPAFGSFNAELRRVRRGPGCGEGLRTQHASRVDGGWVGVLESRLLAGSWEQSIINVVKEASQVSHLEESVKVPFRHLPCHSLGVTGGALDLHQQSSHPARLPPSFWR
jgi:hypothetical protein